MAEPYNDEDYFALLLPKVIHLIFKGPHPKQFSFR